MEQLLQLRRQLYEIEAYINIFFGATIIQPTLNRMMRNRRRVIKKIARIQIRTFNRD